MKLDDAHIHLFKGGFPGAYGTLFPGGHEVKMYERIRQVHGIGRALVVGYEGEPWARGNNSYLAQLCSSRPWMAPLAFCDAEKPVTGKTLRALRSQGIFGISLYVFSAAQAAALIAWSKETVSELNQKRAILSINCPPDIACLLEPFFHRLEETRILLSHLGMPGTMDQLVQQLKPVLALSRIPHVGVKLSGAYACNAYPHPGLGSAVRSLTDAYGPSRLYWGSDFSPALDQLSFPQTIEAWKNLRPACPREVFSKNLQSAIRRVRPSAPSAQ